MSSQVTLLQQMQEMQRVASHTPSIEPNDASAVSFSDAMRDVVGRVNEQQNVASSLMTAVDAGQSDDLVGAMVASQKARNSSKPVQLKKHTAPVTAPASMASGANTVIHPCICDSITVELLGASYYAVMIKSNS